MRFLPYTCIISAVMLVSWIVVAAFLPKQPLPATGAPPYGEAETEVPEFDPWDWLDDWSRPAGPPKVGLQVGHWKNEELPEELAKLHGNTGASGGGKAEWEVNHTIALKTKAILEKYGIVVEVLPATVPPNFWADVFVAIHADGNVDTTVTGFKVAAPWRSLTGKASRLAVQVEREYQAATGLDWDPNISRNMRGYYAFSWWRYEHSLHPMTTAVILETGFLTNPTDRKTIVDNPDLSATGLAMGIINHLEAEGLITGRAG